MNAAIQDDQFSALIEEHKGILYKIAQSYCRNPEDRKDLIQEIVVQLWKSHGRYDSRFKLSTWIYRIALNIAISFYRRDKKRSAQTVPLEEMIIEPAVEPVVSPNEQIAALYRVIAQLDELNRALMILYLDDKSYREIASILGISETNVATKISRLKQKIKEQLTNHQPD